MILHQYDETPCPGMNCGTTDGKHSKECIAEHTAAAAGGDFVKWLPIESAPRNGTVIQILHGLDVYCGWWSGDGDWKFVESTDEHLSGCCDREVIGLIEPNAFIKQAEKNLRWMPLAAPPVPNK
jgi:hypothetical protein